MANFIDFEGKRGKVFDGVDDIGEVVERIDEHAIVYSDHGSVDLCCRKSAS